MPAETKFLKDGSVFRREMFEAIRIPVLLMGCALLWVASSCSPAKKLDQLTSTQYFDTVFRNAHIGIAVYDLEAQQMLYKLNAEKYFIPASNMKWLTLFSTLQTFPDSLPGCAYKNEADTLYIRPLGDPLLLHPKYSSQQIMQFLSAEKKPICFLLPYANPAKYGPGWAWDDAEENYMLERSVMPIYGNSIWLDTLNLQIFPPGIINNPDSFTRNNRIRYPAHYSLIQSVQLLADTLHKNISFRYDSVINTPSQRMSAATNEVLKKMMWQSDNFLAEQLLLMASCSSFGNCNTTTEIETLLHSRLSKLSQRPQWVDGSGLSRYNLISPLSLCQLIHLSIQQFGLNRIKYILPTGGQGTLKNYFASDSGYVFLKTGSMSNNSSISGIIQTKSGRWLIVAYMANSYTSNLSVARREMEYFIKKLREVY